MRKTLIALAVAASPVLALDMAGKVMGSVGETGFLSEIWADQSDYDDYGTGGVGGAVSILTTDIARDNGLGVMMLSFEGMDFWSAPLDLARVAILVPESDPPQAYVADQEDGLAIEFANLSFDGSTLSVIGSVSGTLSRELLITHERDEGDSLSVDFVFEAFIEAIDY